MRNVEVWRIENKNSASYKLEMWPSSIYGNVLETYYRGSRKKYTKEVWQKARKPKSPILKKQVAEKVNVPKAKEFLNYSILDLLTTKPLGRGEFGATYRHSKDLVIKVIELHDQIITKETIQSEVNIHTYAQNIKNADQTDAQCVPKIHDGPHFYTLAEVPPSPLSPVRRQYATYTMDSLLPYDISIDTDIKNVERSIDIILNKNKLLLENGIMHNDLHQGNIMMTPKNEAIIIDMGLARYSGNINKTSNKELFDCIYFAQSAALFDNCNTNTKCPTTYIEQQLEKKRKAVLKYFDLELHQQPFFKNAPSIQSLIEKISTKLDIEQEKEMNNVTCKLQFVLACLSTKFVTCMKGQDWESVFDDDFCDEGQIEGDYVYACRNPTAFKCNVDQIYYKMCHNIPLGLGCKVQKETQ